MVVRDLLRWHLHQLRVCLWSARYYANGVKGVNLSTSTLDGWHHLKLAALHWEARKTLKRLHEVERERDEGESWADVVHRLAREREAVRKLGLLLAEELIKESGDLQVAKAHLRAVRAGVDEVWRWQGDGEDHPESLSCPVVMSAARLREILREVNPDNGRTLMCNVCGETARGVCVHIADSQERATMEERIRIVAMGRARLPPNGGEAALRLFLDAIEQGRTYP